MEKLSGAAKPRRLCGTEVRFLIFLLICALLTATPARAAWDGTASADPTWDDAEEIYTISLADQLAGFRDWINAGDSNDQTYRLSGDIDLGSHAWTPIGAAEASAFTGKFEGSGHTVSNFKIVSSDYPYGAAGLFGYLSGDISNLGATDFVVSVDRKNGEIRAGGLAGQLMSGDITRSYATGGVSAFASAFPSYAGGLAGEVTGGGRVAASYATGGVSASSSTSAASAGGLAGQVAKDGAVENSYAAGSVSASSHYSNANAGGLAGHSAGSVRESYAAGRVLSSGGSSSRAGGLVGFLANDGSVFHCVFDRQGAGLSQGIGEGRSDGVTAKSSEEMASGFTDSSWTTRRPYYPQIKVLADSSSIDVRQVSAFSVAALRFFPTGRFASEDTSAAAAHSILVPALTAYVVESGGLPVTWTWTPEEALISADWSGDQALLAPRKPGPLVSSTENVSGGVKLTAAIETSSGKTVKREFPVFFKGHYSNYAQSSSDIPGPGITLTLRHAFPETAQGALSTLKPFNGAVRNTDGAPAEILLWSADAGENAGAFLLYEENEGKKTAVESLPVDVEGRRDFHILPQLNLPTGSYAVSVVASSDGKIENLYKLSLNVISDDESGSGKAETAQVMVSEEELDLEPGYVRTLYAQISPMPSDLAGRDVEWSVFAESEEGVITIVSKDIEWADLWGIAEGSGSKDIEESESAAKAAGANAADTDTGDTGALANLKLMVKANKAGTAIVKARVDPPFSDTAETADFCNIKVSAPEAEPNGGGGSDNKYGCAAFGLGAGAALFLFAAAVFLIKKKK